MPPYVTLDPPAKLVQPSFNLGSGDGVIPNGQTAPIFIHYTPYNPSPAENDNMTLSFNINNTPVTARVNSYIMDGRHGISINAGGRYAMGLTTGAVTGLPSNITVFMPPIGTLSGFTLNLNAQGQDSYFTLTITNNSGVTQTVTNIQLVPDLQDRKFGGRVDGTTLGWVMFEADRIVKDLAIGKEQLTGTAYDSHNATLPAGFQNMLERYLAAGQTGQQNTRLWLTPNYETLKRYIDPVTGEATVVFDQSSVKLNTESLLAGKPEDPIARSFVDFFNAHYDQFAALNFPVHDPADPTGTRTIQVKIFDMLRDAMKAVALARFFHDNNIPLDTWWLNSWTPPKAYIPTTIPTLSNSLSNGTLTLTTWGGVTIKTPNQYLPDDVARIISNAVRSQRTPVTGDLSAQSWTVSNTPMGSLNAVAASLAAVKQDADVTLAATDLSFASPGGEQLSFARYYDSAYLGNQNLGLGWQPFRYDLQFQYPTYVDDYGLMRDGSGKQVPVFGAASDTQLRSGEIRLVDHSTGQVLNFFSSLTTAYSLDNNGNPILQTAGLTSSDVPTFTPGQYKDGTTLSQDPQTKNYTLTAPDGSKLVFDANGRLLTLTDRLGNTITYTYTNGLLSQITDGANQTLTITYGSDGRIQYVAGPDNSATPMRRTAYTYDTGGRLVRVDTQALQSGGTYATARSVQYQYNSSNQLTGVIGPDGITSLTNAPDLRGRSTMRQDPLGNLVDYGFTQDPTTNVRTTQVVDMGTTGLNNPTAQGTDALRYFAAGSTSMTQFDGSDRTTKTMDPLGHATTYGYNGSSVLPNSVTLPTPGRPSISIQRNAVNLPTVINDPANTGGTPVQITYNAANLPMQVTDSKGRVTQYTYTAWNDIQTVTVDFGTSLAATTTYNYNAQKLLDDIVDPLGKTVVRYGYDSLGRVTSVTDGTGVTTTYTYDAVGRLKRVYDPRLTGTVKYIEYTYNDNDQVTQIATPTGNITYQYDPTTHRLTATTDLNGNTTQYAYDPATGALISTTQIATGGNAVTQAMYDRLGNLALLTAPNGNRTAFRYDALGRPTAMIEDGLANPTAAANVQATSPGAVHVAVTASEPILVATLTYWIDGQPRTSGTAQSVRLSDLKTFSFDVTGLDPRQVYRYDLTLTDRVGRMQTLPSRLLTLAPTLTPPSPVEGMALSSVTVATFAAGDTSAQATDFTATITWGDGSTSPGAVSVLSGATFKVTASHTYADEAAGLTFRVQISGVSSANVSGTVTVADASLSAGAVTITPVERVAFSGTVATFRDANPQGPVGDFGATIDWGDGTALDTTSALIAPDGQGGFTVAGRHTFAASGSYTMHVTIRDVGGSTATANSTATVAAAADLGVTQGVDNASPVEGSTIHFTITLSNATGPHPATGVQLTDVLPAGLVFVSATPSAGTYSNSTGVWTVGGLAVGGSAMLQLTATVAYGNGGRSLTNTAAVSHLDQVDPNPANNSAAVTVMIQPAVATSLVVSGFPAAVMAGVPGMVTVTAKDPYGMPVAGYRGTVHFRSSDPQAVLPPDYTFTAADAGVHTFMLTLKTAGGQSITAADTTTGTLTGTQSGIVVSPTAASTLLVAGFPAAVMAGVPGMVTVTAKDSYGNTATGYRGTVHFTSSDLAAQLPADYLFTPADNGVHTFSATLKTATTHSLTATDTTTAGIIGTQAGITVTPAVAASFRVTPAANPVNAGTAFNLTVTALDAYANVATGYIGTVHFTSSDGQAQLPANYAFTAADQGVHTFSVVLKTAGTQAVTATDTQSASLTGMTSITVRPVPAQSLRITGLPASTVAGAAFSLTVAAVDPYGNTATGYTGIVHFTSSDRQARLPADYAFSAADQGVHTFANVSLATAGSQSITATDTQAGSITGTATSTVTPAALDHFQVSTSVTTTVAGTAFDVTVTAQDAYNNTVTGYTGTATFSSADPYGASLPASYTFAAADQGVHAFAAGATLYTAGPWDVTATDTTTGRTGTTTVTATPAAAVQFQVTTSVDSSSTVAGTAFDVTVTAQDPYGNTDVNYAGTVTFTSADPYGATLPADYSFQPTDQGQARFPGGATLYTSGAWDVTATDTAGGISGSATVTVTPAAAVRSQVVAPSSVVPNTPFDVTVIALDPYGNTDVNYLDTITFARTDQDPNVVLPSDYTFTAADAGVHTFAAGVTLVTPGDQTLTVTDSGSRITGSATVTVNPGGPPGPPGGGSRRVRQEIVTAAATRRRERGGGAAEMVDRVFAGPDGDPWLPVIG